MSQNQDVVSVETKAPTTRQESNAVTVASPVTPMQLIATAVEQGKDLDTIERLMDLEQKYKANAAREAYYEALSAFKSQPIRVGKDKVNQQYGSMYTTLGNLVNTVNAAMAPHGLNARWKVEQSNNSVSVTCILSHTLGHSEEVTMSAPPDESGKKNPLQQIKSTMTYLESATFQAVTGVVSQDATYDDDGNAAGGNTLTEDEVVNLEALIEEVGADKPAFLKFCKVDSLEQIQRRNYSQAVSALEERRKKK